VCGFRWVCLRIEERAGERGQAEGYDGDEGEHVVTLAFSEGVLHERTRIYPLFHF